MTIPDRAPGATDVVAPGRVDVRGLTWRPAGRRQPVLRDVDLVIAPGERVLLVGPSGSGKSTLLRAFAGLLLTADSGDLTGSVTIDGRDPHERAGAVGLVLQEPGAGVVAATVGRDVAFGLENLGMPRAEMPARVTAALAEVRLAMPLDTPTTALSGGETQRLALAGALALEPSLLLLDEPTAMLDPGNAQAVRDAVADVTTRRALTTVVVEHVLGPWVPFADRLLVLDHSGRIVADGPPAPVLASRREELAELGVWVPGVPTPRPLAVPARLVSPSGAGPRGRVTASALTVTRTTTTLTGDERTRTAAATPALTLAPATTTALVGPSGSGKSTALLALGGLVTPASGSVSAVPPRGGGPEVATPLAELASHDLASLVAWVPQWSSATIVARTVLDEVLTTTRALGLPEAEAGQRAQELLHLVGLEHLSAADPRHLSGGEQRRLALVAAVAHGPRLVLADEPTVGQDRLTWAAVVGLLDAARRSGAAVVTATHDQAVIDHAHEVVTLTAPPRPTPELPRRTLASRCNPLALMAATLGGIVAAVASPTLRISLVALAVEVLLGLVALAAPGPGTSPRGRVRRVAVRILPGLVGAASIAWSTWLFGGRDPELIAHAGMRIVLFVVPAALVVPYIDPDQLGDQLAQRLRLPARLVVALSAALQRFNTFADAWGSILAARRIRGIGGGRSPRAVLGSAWAMTFGTLVLSLGAAAQLAVAMDARGFATAYRRTWFTPAPWRAADTIAVVLGSVPAAVVLALAAWPGQPV